MAKSLISQLKALVLEQQRTIENIQNNEALDKLIVHQGKLDPAEKIGVIRRHVTLQEKFKLRYLQALTAAVENPQPPLSAKQSFQKVQSDFAIQTQHALFTQPLTEIDVLLKNLQNLQNLTQNLDYTWDYREGNLIASSIVEHHADVGSILLNMLQQHFGVNFPVSLTPKGELIVHYQPALPFLAQDKIEVEKASPRRKLPTPPLQASPAKTAVAMHKRPLPLVPLETNIPKKTPAVPVKAEKNSKEGPKKSPPKLL